MPLPNQNPNSSGVDQVATTLMDTLTAELPSDAALVVLPPSKAAGLVVASQEDRSVCSALLGDVKKKIAAIEEDRKRLTRPLDALKRMIMDKYRPAAVFFEGEKAIYESKLTVWDAEQTRLRVAEEARVRAETEALRAAEVAAARESARIEREEADRLRMKAELEKDIARQEQMRQEAAEREEQGRLAAMERIERAEMISTPTVAPAVSHIGGESQSWKYSAECLDLRLVVKAVAEGRLPLSCVEFATVGANKLAVALQEEFRAQYPEATTGVRLVKTPVYSHRKGRAK